MLCNYIDSESKDSESEDSESEDSESEDSESEDSESEDRYSLSTFTHVLPLDVNIAVGGGGVGS